MPIRDDYSCQEKGFEKLMMIFELKLEGVVKLCLFIRKLSLNPLLVQEFHAVCSFFSGFKTGLVYVT